MTYDEWWKTCPTCGGTMESYNVGPKPKQICSACGKLYWFPFSPNEEARELYSEPYVANELESTIIDIFKGGI